METGLYYLQSRYYDPEIGRFINADGIIAGVNGSIQEYNSITTTIARDVVANVHGALIVGGLQMVGDLIYSIARS